VQARKSGPPVLNGYEQNALLRQPNPKAATGLRNLCIIVLMLKAGLRTGEITELQADSFDWDERKIYISESGGAESRILLLAADEIDILSTWNAKRPFSSPYFLCTLAGDKLKDRYIREMIKRLARKADIKKDVHPHMLRHTFAADLLRETGDLTLVQKALGHRDISATRIYMNLAPETKGHCPDGPEEHQRSGIPELEDQQMQFKLPDEKYGHKDNRGNDSPAQEKEEADTLPLKEDQGLLSMSNNRAAASVKKERDPGETGESGSIVKEAGITIETRRVPIPAIKCSKCSYILRFQENCPQCGEPFISILKHWGRRI